MKDKIHDKGFCFDGEALLNKDMILEVVRNVI